MGSNRQTYLADLTDTKSTSSRGKLIIRLDSVAISNDEARMRVRADLIAKGGCCFAGVNNPYIVISKSRGGMNQAEYVRVF